MSALVLTLRRQPTAWVDMSPITPERLAGMSRRSLRRVRLRHGRRELPLPELFEIDDGDAKQIQIRRSTSQLIRIGAEMGRGRIEVRGHAGQHLGTCMRGGSISVQGDAGDWAASGMSGGSIYISGNCGDFAGSACSGAAHGMSDGWVTVRGNCGARLGDGMRRGTILVFGDCGDYAGSQMVAGTLIILGRSGRHAGIGMRRGTIVLGRRPAHLVPTFQNCGVLKMEFLRLLFKATASFDRRFGFFRGFGPEVHRYAGDTAVGGRGELLVLLNAPGEQRA